MNLAKPTNQANKTQEGHPSRMRRYCGCGRPIWVLTRKVGSEARLIFYDDGEANVWMPISACPHCGVSLDTATLDPYRSALLPPPGDDLADLTPSLAE